MKINTKFYRRNLPLRLSLRVVVAMNLLLMATLFVMFFYSRKVMREDALQRASQTLEGAMVKVDNILLSVEETTGNVFFDMLFQINNPEMMYTYSRRIVETNPYITSCAIAFKPGFYKDHETFLAYYHRQTHHGLLVDSLVVCDETVGEKPYTELVWFTKPMEVRKPMWLDPQEGMASATEPMTSFCLPLTGFDGNTVGVMSVNVSLSLLSGFIATSKPSPNSYCALLDREGSFIVHPSGEHLKQPVDYGLPQESLHQILNNMMSGKTDYIPLSVGDKDLYVFYKPFVRAYVPNRSMEDLGWTIAVAMPKDDIYGEFNRLFNYAIIIGIGGMLMLFFSCWAILYLRLRPLKMLTEKAERIAQGHYNEPIPNTWSRDEIGSLQRNFIRMRRALAEHIGELEQLTKTIQVRSDELKMAYKQAKKAEKLKTAFLHHMTNQMVAPVQAIDEDVMTLIAIGENTDQVDAVQLVDHIQHNGNTITQLLNQMLNQSEEEMRKEVEHD